MSKKRKDPTGERTTRYLLATLYEAELTGKESNCFLEYFIEWQDEMTNLDIVGALLYSKTIYLCPSGHLHLSDSGRAEAKKIFDELNGSRLDGFNKAAYN